MLTKATELAIERIKPHCPKCGRLLEYPKEPMDTPQKRTACYDVSCDCGAVVLAQFFKSMPIFGGW